jgi:hypothetical protein
LALALAVTSFTLAGQAPTGNPTLDPLTTISVAYDEPISAEPISATQWQFNAGRVVSRCVVGFTDISGLVHPSVQCEEKKIKRKT